MIHVFVYGTLKPGEKNYQICASHVIAAKPASANGCLYALPFGYPAMTLEVGTVHGMVLSFADETVLEALDAYERHDPAEFYASVPNQSLEQNEYDRQKITVYDQAKRELGQAWTYLMTKAQVQRLSGVFLPDGQWHQQ
ncbi:MAG: gamma-glutamylcyclotransferase [Stenomitos rutilans HA7619-LM2]|jgi:gamma-glutamylcyclotransferase (GGCT)/AIG2-like uncharacterized protein YtfP|nr:gamma-glutamylcyclotransferase [Stenomitos rutilans HA7619-LM2]